MGPAGRVGVADALGGQGLTQAGADVVRDEQQRQVGRRVPARAGSREGVRSESRTVLPQPGRSRALPGPVSDTTVSARRPATSGSTVDSSCQGGRQKRGDGD